MWMRDLDAMRRGMRSPHSPTGVAQIDDARDLGAFPFATDANALAARFPGMFTLGAAPPGGDPGAAPPGGAAPSVAMARATSGGGPVTVVGGGYLVPQLPQLQDPGPAPGPLVARATDGGAVSAQTPVVIPPPVIGQAVTQAMGGGPAASLLGSVLGAGLGGVLNGTGPLPGAFGQIAQSLYGQPGLPPGMGGNFPGQVDAYGQLIAQTALGTTPGELAAIRQLMQDRAVQIAATAEHRLMMSNHEFRVRVLWMLRQLLLRGAGGAPALGALDATRRY